MVRTGEGRGEGVRGEEGVEAEGREEFFHCGCLCRFPLLPAFQTLTRVFEVSRGWLYSLVCTMRYLFPLFSG